MLVEEMQLSMTMRIILGRANDRKVRDQWVASRQDAEIQAFPQPQAGRAWINAPRPREILGSPRRVRSMPARFQASGA